MKTRCDWLYWVGLLAVALFAWLVFRVVVRQEYQSKGSLSPRGTTLEFLVFGIHANLPYLYLPAPWPAIPALPEKPFQLVLGLSLAAVGSLSTLAIMAWLGFRTTLGNQPRQLRQSGPYRCSRNPQLLSYGLLLLGCLVLYPSWQAGAWLILYAAIAHWMVQTEEDHLRALFGAEFAEYCRKVPRFVPRPGKGGILSGKAKE